MNLRFSRRYSLKRVLLNTAIFVYGVLVIFALTNGSGRVKVEEFNIYTDPAYLRTDSRKCKVDLDSLDVFPIDLFEKATMEEVEQRNPNVDEGGSWKPKDCEAWQKVAIIVPYRNRYEHLILLFNRLHPMLQRQKIEYRIFVIEQAFDEKFNRGRLMNVGVIESLKYDNFSCFVLHDADLLPEHDRNMYFCDDSARHLASAIDEMRYHVMYYSYLGGVTSVSQENLFRINGYGNDYWGWGNEDDDLSARIMESGLMISRPPDHIGRFKMVRHVKEWRADNGYDLFISWRSRWKTDGLNNMKNKYTVLYKSPYKLYTNITVDIGKPPVIPPIDNKAPKESLVWFLKFFFP